MVLVCKVHVIFSIVYLFSNYIRNFKPKETLII